GRAGGSNNDTGAGGNAGDGLRAHNFVDLVNDGLIIGGNGGDGASITDHAGYGGIGVFLYGGALANLGTVAGGSGGIGGSGGGGEYGVLVWTGGGTVTNLGTIAAGGASASGSRGRNGV